MIIKTYLKRNAINQEIALSKKVNVACNLCQSTKHILMGQEQEFNVCKCLKCDLVYINPQASSEDLKDYYASYYPEITEVTIGNWENTKSFNQVLKIIDKYYPDGGYLLDLGCGLGLFTEKANKEKWNLVGLDLSDKAIQFASSRNKNISFICGDIFDSNLISDNSFDVVTALSFLEHQTDPMKTLKRIYQILKPGGRAILRVPYIMPWFYMKKYFPFIPVKFQAPMHLYDFSPKVLKSFLDKSDYENTIILISAPDDYSNVLTKIIIDNIKNISKMLNALTLRKYIFPLAGGLLGVGQKKNCEIHLKLKKHTK